MLSARLKKARVPFDRWLSRSSFRMTWRSDRTIRTEDSAPKVTRAAIKPPSREGLVHVGAWLPEAYSRRILLLRAKTGMPVKTIFAKALNDLFRAHGVPVIGEE